MDSEKKEILKTFEDIYDISLKLVESTDDEKVLGRIMTLGIKIQKEEDMMATLEVAMITILLDRDKS